MWLQDHYIYRRPLALYSPTTVSAGDPVTVVLSTNLRDNGKLRLDFEDIEVVYETEDATPENVVLYREVEQDGLEIKVHFNLYEDLPADTTIEDRYYVYYGNLELTDPPIRQDSAIVDWPVTIPFDGEIAYTRPGEHWVDGKSDTFHARASLLFYGTKVRILSDVNLFGGMMEVQVDNGDWQVVDLFSSIEEESAEVFFKDDLDPEIKHEVRARVSGEVNPSALDGVINIKSIEYRKSVIATDSGEELKSLVWSSFVGGG